MFDGVLPVVVKLRKAFVEALTPDRVTGLLVMLKVMVGSEGERERVKVTGPLAPVLPLPFPEMVTVVVTLVARPAVMFVLAGFAVSEPYTFGAALAK